MTEFSPETVKERRTSFLKSKKKNTNKKTVHPEFCAQ